MNFKIILLIFSLFFTIQTHGQEYDVERSKYLKALKYFKNKDYKNFKILKKQLVNYPLYIELEYKELHRKKNINNDDVIAFIKKYKTSYLSQKAYVNLIYRLSKKNDTEKLIKNYQKTDSIDLQCLYIRARIKRNMLYKIEEEIIPIWLSGKSQPKSCDFIFKWFYKNKKMTDELVWQRINIALASNNYSLARYLVRFISNKNKIWANKLLKVYISPRKNLISKSFENNNRYRETIFSIGLDRISKKNYISAIKYLNKVKSLYKASDEFYNKKIIEIFTIALKTNQKNIFQNNDFNNIKTSNNDFYLALGNYAIFNSNWAKIIETISFFPESIAKEEKWSYWYGKSLYKLKDENYKIALDNLSKKRSYYGFLSALILNRKINVVNIPYKVQKEDLEKVASINEVKRMRELYILGKRRSAREELQYFFRNSNEKNLNTINVLFKKWGWSIGSILGYGNTKYFDDLESRFPVLYENYFDKYSKSNIEKSLLLGIARKESIFIQYAKSSAGAVGIMQVLPKTAYWVLKKNKKKKVSINYLYNKKLNIFVGSYYFKYLLSKKKSYVEAIASYNAGLYNVSKWRKNNYSAEDSWIESIPFNETRKYVKLVIEYSLVYDWILNNKSTIRVSQLINIK